MDTVNSLKVAGGGLILVLWEVAKTEQTENGYFRARTCL